MPNLRLLCLCLLAFASQGATRTNDSLPTPQPLESVIVMQVDGSVAIDPNGKVSGLTIDTQLPETIRAPLDRKVRNWHFERAIGDGAARTTNAKIRVILSALDQGGGNYQIRVDNVVFPRESGTANETAPLITGRSLPPPRYPEHLERLGIAGTVLLAVEVNAEGQVAQVMVVQSALFDVEGDKATLAKAVQMLEKSAAAAAQAWQFDVANKDGLLSAKEMTVIVPVVYEMRGKKLAAPGTWRIEARVPRRPIAWLQSDPDVDVIGVDDVISGEVLAVDSKLKLTTKVDGTIL